MTTATLQPSMKLEDFRRIITAYQQATERLKDSHDLLMSEVSRLRAELEAKNQQFERRKRLAALGEMAAGVAHEIRNPLGSIQLYADLLARQLQDEPKKCDLAGKIGKAVRGLDAIVSDMLTFTRVIEANRTPTRFADLVAEAVSEASGRLETSGVTLNLGQIAPALTIDLDPRLFKRVLLNLMLNAADAMADQPITRMLTITAEALSTGHEAGRWRVRVADTGPGIRADVIEKIFHPFFTTKDHGTGLGLAIVHHIVEAHGGTITAANRAEGGAVFAILLP
ncbi:MAG: ATP-binding protein [Phycisphaerae bacterium]|nr:ATP-binding protein [Phycisphaerae bacterium]